LTYKELAGHIKKHGLPKETKNSIAAELKRETLKATFLLATPAWRATPSG
jgi:hypothetical protein